MAHLLFPPPAGQPPPSNIQSLPSTRVLPGPSSGVFGGRSSSNGHTLLLRLPAASRRRLSSLTCVVPHDSSVTSFPDPSLLTASVQPSPPLAPSATLSLTLGRRHIFVLNAVACITAISATWLFFSAIPTLLAIRKAAISLEKLLDTMREELPDTMAAIRLSGMEISDLTMELSDLGQEITQGVKSSTRAVRIAEDRLRRLTNMSPAASVQVQKTSLRNQSDQTSLRNQSEGPVLARTARSLREGIVKGRAILGVMSSLTHFFRIGWNFLAARRRRRVL